MTPFEDTLEQSLAELSAHRRELAETYIALGQATAERIRAEAEHAKLAAEYEASCRALEAIR